MKKVTFDLLMAAGIALAMLLSGFKGFAQQCEDIRSEVLRLHIPANSDSEYDQTMKLKLRDFVLEKYGQRLSDSGTLAAAREEVTSLLSEIERDCCGFLAANGADYTAKAELCEMYFTTRVYENVTLPAGTYEALRITLGSGEGKNWWCVMFPPLCIPAASEVREKAENALPDVLVSSRESEKVEIKFAIFEFFKWIMGEN